MIVAVDPAAQQPLISVHAVQQPPTPKACPRSPRPPGPVSHQVRDSAAAADELRELIATLDDTTLAHNGFWETLCNDVEIGDYANWRD